ncbi:MAG: BTAD domain-containing putative transcriptional regulator [Oscillospiraceae bacterium]
MHIREPIISEPEIKINMLGGFTLSVDETIVTDNSKGSHQVWNLLEYLAIYHKKPISQEQLIQVLWPDETSNNPTSALKNLIYRLRTTLENLKVPYGKDLILTQNGMYAWNNAAPCTIDVEEFEKLYQRSSACEPHSKERLEYCLKAIDLYKGDLLPSSSYEEWVIPLSLNYRTIYFKCVYQAAEILSMMSAYEKLEEICKKALDVDQFEEQAHMYLIMAKMKQGNQAAALAQYNYVVDLFYRELGVTPSKELHKIYREIIKADDCSQTDLSIIKEELNEHNALKGALYCDYEVFKNLYRMEARTAERTGRTIFVALLSISNNLGNIPSQKTLIMCMDKLKEIIQTSLRKGDVVSRISKSQYILMLPNLTFENGQMVLGRITGKYKQLGKQTGTEITTSLQSMDILLE